MTTDPAIQRAYDAVSAEHEAASTAISQELRARLREVSERLPAVPPEPSLEDDDEVPAFRWDEL
jgi:hypothetical protein